MRSTNRGFDLRAIASKLLMKYSQPGSKRTNSASTFHASTMGPGRLTAATAVVFLALQLSQASADVVTYDWRLTPIMTAFDGVRLQTLGVNGKPSHEAVIDVQLGQEVQVRVTNELSESTCLHWYGMKQLGTQEMDGMSGFTQCAIEPNNSATYHYTPDKAGTFWWHSHHGTQYAYGLRGPLIVHVPDNGAKRWDHEYTIQMADIYHAPPPPAPFSGIPSPSTTWAATTAPQQPRTTWRTVTRTNRCRHSTSCRDASISCG
ncbi:hypothetical protein ON010_g13461 [Phytophthora cinnamomi]|nr:hypothetical protein ON010_g13461 [Phytophthora cinnamomi]